MRRSLAIVLLLAAAPAGCILNPFPDMPGDEKDTPATPAKGTGGSHSTGADSGGSSANGATSGTTATPGVARESVK